MENQTAYYAPVQPEAVVRTKPQIDIVARIKCRASTFGTVLMWVYIAAVAIVAITLAVLFGILAYSIGTLLH